MPVVASYSAVAWWRVLWRRFLNKGRHVLSVGLENHREGYNSAAVYNIIKEGQRNDLVVGQRGSLTIAVTFTATEIGACA